MNILIVANHYAGELWYNTRTARVLETPPPPLSTIITGWKHTMNDTPTKKCSKCGNVYPATTEHFSKKKGCKFGINSICKGCGAAYTRQWVADNPDKKRASDKQWAETHRELEREYSRRAYWKDPEKSRAYTRAKQERNRTRVRESSRAWNQRNREHVTARIREWRRSNPEKARAAKLRRRAMEFNAEGSHTAEDIRILVKSQKGLCWWCGNAVGDEYHIDHRIPLSRGGSNAPENLCITCPSCNQSKTDKLPSEWNGRLL